MPPQVYLFDNAENQWRMLRVRNATHDASYIEWDPLFTFQNVSFYALFDVAADPWQQANVYGSLSAASRAAWAAELAAEFKCKGQHGLPTDCS